MAPATDAPLSISERADLATLAGTMIPQDPALGMPGADDPAIQADIAQTIGRDLPLVRQALAALAAKSASGLAQLDRDRREALVNDWYKAGGAAAAALGRVILAAYYRDDRVLVALGHEA